MEDRYNKEKLQWCELCCLWKKIVRDKLVHKFQVNEGASLRCPALIHMCIRVSRIFSELSLEGFRVERILVAVAELYDFRKSFTIALMNYFQGW